MHIKLCVPGSKSMTQRALMIGALASRDTLLRGPLLCDDSAHLSRILTALGAHVHWGDGQVVIRPAELRATDQVLPCGNGGTAIRFAACLSLVTPGRMTLDGDDRMRERPIGPLGDALVQLGVGVHYGARAGYPPLTLERLQLAASSVAVDGGSSSQFASGLLLVAPRLPHGLTVHLVGDRVSLPYLRMTTTMMSKAGAQLRWLDDGAVHVEPTPYFSVPGDAVLDIEPDWSSAAFLLAAGFVMGCEVELDGLPSASESCQGDAVFGTFLGELRLGREHDFDLSSCPDLIAPLTAASLFASHPCRIHGVAHARLKESDRIAVLVRELRRLGARLQELPDGLRVMPLDHRDPGDVLLEPQGDHRMAMAFGVVSLRLRGIRVSDPHCVTKSFPSFWTQLDALRSGGS